MVEEVSQASLEQPVDQLSKAKTIKEVLGEQLTGMISLSGWVKTRRDSKAGLSFIQLNDGSCMRNLQVVALNSLSNYEEEILSLTSGCSIKATGEIVQSQGKNQSVEMQATAIEIIGEVQDPNTYPIQPKRHTMEYLREVAHLRPRTNTHGAMARVRHMTSKLIHDFLHSEGFNWIHTPIITGNDCEGAGDLFRVSTLEQIQADTDYSTDFFGKETFLTVSGQLNVEAFCLALSKVYTFGPTFRAENSNTSRHLAEFWMVEPEIAFADLTDLANFCERMLKTLFKDVLEHSAEDMAFFNQFIDKECIARLEAVINSDFERLSYTDAIGYLEKAKKKFEYPVKWGLDLQSEHERYLTEKLFKKPVILTDYPKDIKGFYMRQNEDDKTVAAMDILVPGIGEIIGGSQREERYDKLEKRIEEMGIDKDHYQWYLDLRKYGTVPHSGFGLGLERVLSYITGLSNVRDVIPFPRTPNNASF